MRKGTGKTRDVTTGLAGGKPGGTDSSAQSLVWRRQGDRIRETVQECRGSVKRKGGRSSYRRERRGGAKLD